MAKKVIATAGSLIAFALSMLWLITLTIPWDWLWSHNTVVMIKVNLFSIHLERALTSKLISLGVSLISFEASTVLDSLLDQSLWMETAVQQLCMTGVEAIWKWCDTWTMVKFGSLIMAILGYIAAVLLAMGGVFMYYYTHCHATSTGRKWLLSCLAGAPACCVLGMLQYIVLTFQMGRGDQELLGGKAEASYGPGFLVACALTLLSLAPLFIQVACVKSDPNEKQGDTEAEVDTASYGATAYSQVPQHVQGVYPGTGGRPPPPVFSAQPQEGQRFVHEVQVAAAASAGNVPASPPPGFVSG